VADRGDHAGSGGAPFSTLGLQSYWYDEAVTVRLVGGRPPTRCCTRRPGPSRRRRSTTSSRGSGRESSVRRRSVSGRSRLSAAPSPSLLRTRQAGSSSLALPARSQPHWLLRTLSGRCRSAAAARKAADAPRGAPTGRRRWACRGGDCTLGVPPVPVEPQRLDRGDSCPGPRHELGPVVSRRAVLAVASVVDLRRHLRSRHCDGDAAMHSARASRSDGEPGDRECLHSRATPRDCCRPRLLVVSQLDRSVDPSGTRSCLWSRNAAQGRDRRPGRARRRDGSHPDVLDSCRDRGYERAQRSAKQLARTGSLPGSSPRPTRVLLVSPAYQQTVLRLYRRNVRPVPDGAGAVSELDVIGGLPARVGIPAGFERSGRACSQSITIDRFRSAARRSVPPPTGDAVLLSDQPTAR
jgi:hypothetical protein